MIQTLLMHQDINRGTEKISHENESSIRINSLELKIYEEICLTILKASTFIYFD